MLVHFNRLIMNHVKVWVETLCKSFGELFLHWNGLIWILVDSAFKLLQTITEIRPLSGLFKCGQYSCHLLRKILLVYSE